MQVGKGRDRHAERVGGRSLRLRGGRSHSVSLQLDGRGRRLLKTDHHFRLLLVITQGKRVVLHRRFELRYRARKRATHTTTTRHGSHT